MSTELQPFSVDVPEAVLDDLRDRLARTRWPDQIPGSGWGYGTDLAYLRDVCETWRTTFDWRAQEKRFNQWPHVLTDIDGQTVHCIHARSPEPDAFPLVITHGWPGSVAEFLDIIGPLSDPRAHGGDPADAFHVVCPSIPGYGWSGPTHEPGWDVRRVAETIAQLMARLGYDRYGAQGGDWGAQVTTRIGAYDAEHCVGIHVNMPITEPPKEQVVLSDDDKAALADFQQFRQEETGYAVEQSTKPQTVGVGLNDSPAGLLAWIVEKFRTWSDCDGEPENAFTRDDLLTNVMIYWVTQTITSSARLYWERQHSAERPDYVAVPTGVARFPKEPLRFPRPWVERSYNVTHWTEMPRGGHFAAMEQPELFVADVRAFFATVR
jgi:pimeloyl-ACP methyl ester carboxylesterase